MQLEHARDDLKTDLFGSRSLAGRLAGFRDRLFPKDGLRLEARIFGRPVRVELSSQAAAAAAALPSPLTVEMELYFSCLVRKAVRFRSELPDAALPAGAHTGLVHQLNLQFRPVTTQHCALDRDAPPLETMPVTRPEAFVPRWLRIDVHQGVWIGDYGY